MTRILRHIKEGFIGVFRNFALSLSSISSVTVTLLIMAAFLLLSSNLSQITTQLESSVQIHVQVSASFESQEELDRIEKEIKAIENVSTITFSSKDEELEAFIALDDSEDYQEMYGSYRGETNPLLNAFLVDSSKPESLSEIADSIRLIEGVENAGYGGDKTALFVNAMQGIRNVGIIIVAALGVIAVFLISNTIRVSIHSRKREISIMRTVGATNWYIRWPFIIEGMLIGLIGSIVPIAITYFGYTYLMNTTGGNLFFVLTLVPSMPLILNVSLVLMGIGVVVGALGSIFSVGKMLRWSR